MEHSTVHPLARASTFEFDRIELKIPVSTIWLSSMSDTGPKARIACFRTFQEGSLASKSNSETPNWLSTSDPRIEAASWKRSQATTRYSGEEFRAN